MSHNKCSVSVRCYGHSFIEEIEWIGTPVMLTQDLFEKQNPGGGLETSPGISQKPFQDTERPHGV